MATGKNAVLISVFLVLLVCAAAPVSAGKKGGYDPVVSVGHTKRIYVAPVTTKKGAVILHPPPPPPPKKVVVVVGKKGG
ncbi:hypothetical protein BSKO_13487 [Bryopsis sp. KO-2023]|nr:hypothetical protein BSKO_13487 [Bryopsis sp. KO-2023]